MKRSLVWGATAVAGASLVLAGCASTPSSSESSAAASSAPAASAAATTEASVAASAASSAEGAASSEAYVPPTVAVADAFDITKLCGDKPTVVAAIDGFGGDTWRKTTLAELQSEAKKCPNITEVKYTNANGDQQKMISAIKSYADQGVNVLIVFPDFGPALLPAMKDATDAGVKVVDYFVDLGGKIPEDYAALVAQDSFANGKQWADWYGKNLVNGNVLMIGGPAGAKSSENFFNGFKEGVAAYPGLKLLEDNYVVTNWSPVDAQKAVAGLMAKYPQIDGIASDYGVTSNAAVKAFQAAGKPVPAIAQIASNNEMNCAWADAKAKGEEYPYFSLEGTTFVVRSALRQGLAAYQGTADPEPGVLPTGVGIDTFAGMDPKCDKAAPPDADLYSGLTTEELQAVFAGGQ